MPSRRRQGRLIIAPVGRRCGGGGVVGGIGPRSRRSRSHGRTAAYGCLARSGPFSGATRMTCRQPRAGEYVAFPNLARCRLRRRVKGRFAGLGGRWSASVSDQMELSVVVSTSTSSDEESVEKKPQRRSQMLVGGIIRDGCAL